MIELEYFPDKTGLFTEARIAKFAPLLKLRIPVKIVKFDKPYNFVHSSPTDDDNKAATTTTHTHKK